MARSADAKLSTPVAQFEVVSNVEPLDHAFHGMFAAPVKMNPANGSICTPVASVSRIWANMHEQPVTEDDTEVIARLRRHISARQSRQQTTSSIRTFIGLDICCIVVA